MARRCASCGQESRGEERYCTRCGRELTAAGPDTGTRDPLYERLGEVLGPGFELAQRLGRGGQAVVYLARELALQRLVAVKVMVPGGVDGDEARRRFRDEATTIAGLIHPNIVTLFSVRQLEDFEVLIMQYLAGGSLAAIVPRAGERLPRTAVCRILSQVGDGLHHAHRRGVVHRDVKPANILFDADGNAVVTDFGIAKRVHGGALVTGPRTRSGTFLGTLPYMSPEQFDGRLPSAAADQYSLGVVAFELLTSQLPYSGTDLEIMRGHVEGEIPSLRRLWPECPPAADDTLRRMLAKEPEDRFVDIGTAVDRLTAAIERRAYPTPPTMPASPRNVSSSSDRQDGSTGGAASNTRVPGEPGLWKKLRDFFGGDDAGR